MNTGTGCMGRWKGCAAALLLVCAAVVLPPAASAAEPSAAYEKWNSVGVEAAERAAAMMTRLGASPQKGAMIVLTNAGYAEVNGARTAAALDGAASVTGASRGRHTLVEIRTGAGVPLWFAVYDPSSGLCAYFEASPTGPEGTFRTTAVERIDAAYLRTHPAETKAKFDRAPFGGNEFRIVSIANAVAAGAPDDVMRVLEFHDHYCPGVSSGILMARYLKKRFPPGKGGYFIHSVDRWCKEDALMVMLGVSPARGDYAVHYPSEADKKRRLDSIAGADTLVYRQNDATGRWEALLLAFEWAETPCPDTGNGIVDKLCADFWYLERLDKPEGFIKVLKRIDLPEGFFPRDGARPGIDPLERLGLLKP